MIEMLGLARQVLEERATLGDARHVVLTAKADAGDLDAWLADRQSRCFSWFPGTLAIASDPWSIVGVGDLFCIEASGRDRWKRLRDASAAAFARLVERREPGVVAPRLRLFGGASFHPTVTDATWKSFGSATFIFPRWMFGVRDNDAFVRFAFEQRELATPDALLAEIEAKLSRAGQGTSLRAISAMPASARAENDAAWTPLVERALREIDRGPLEKIVVARRTIIAESISATATFTSLRAQNPEATSFAFHRDGDTFLGATPERLIFSDGTRLFTEALAGTIARRTDDDAAKKELLSNDKDLREHRIVIQGIARALEPFTTEIDLPQTPIVRTLGRLHHLATPIVARLSTAAHVLSLVAALHPTPALAGLPKAAAVAWILEHEPFERGWYGAPVGWFDDAGHGAFVVAIRSALVTRDRTWLFAGGGIVRGSEPAIELGETRLKLKTMSEALVRA